MSEHTTGADKPVGERLREVAGAGGDHAAAEVEHGDAARW